MIEISKDSIEYRFMLYGTFFKPKWKHEHNLCPFIRRMILGCMMALVVWPLVGALVMLPLATPIMHLVVSLYFWDFSYFLVPTPMFLAGIILYGFIVALLIAGALETVRIRIEQRSYQRTIHVDAVPKKESVIIHYIKAVHEKICPSIQIVD